MKKSHEFQLLYYIYYLKNEKGLNNIVGYLNYPTIRKKVKIELTEDKGKELDDVLYNINKIIESSIPKPKKSRICRKCAYFEFCFA